MRKLFASMAIQAGLAFVLTMQAQGDKAVTIKGRITCAKCDLGKEATCMTVIVAKDKDKKDVTYYFDTTSSKKYHSKVCTEAAEGTVVGTVADKGEKKIVTVTKVTFDEKKE